MATSTSRWPASAWRPFGWGAPPSSAPRRRPGALPRLGAWWALAAVLLIVAVTAAGVLTLQERAQSHTRQQILMTRFDAGIDRERLVAWRALSEQTLSAVSIVELSEARRRSDAVLLQLVDEGGVATVVPIRGQLEAYRAAVNDALQLLAAGQLAQAARLDQTQLTPRFAPLRDATTEATLASGYEAAAASRRANELSVALVGGAVLTIGSLGWRVDRDRRAAARLAGEHGALRRSEERFRSLVRHASDLIAVVDRGGVCRYASPASDAVLGRLPEQTVDAPFERAFPDDTTRFRVFLTAALARPGLVGPVELRGRLPDGAARTLELVASHPEAGAGIDGVVLTVRDVTERERAARETAAALATQRAANAELERLNRIRSDFVTAVSHEFRTPLTTIQGFSELIRDQELSPEEVQGFADDINRNARHLGRLIGELLELDRLRSGEVPLRRDAVDLNACVVDAAGGGRPGATDLPLRLDLDPALPPVLGDRDLLARAVANLVDGAVALSPVAGEVLIETDRSGEDARLAVHLGDGGFPTEALGTAFDRFPGTAGEPGAAGQGTGLGLAIARAIVERHGGRIWTEQDPGEGSVVRVALPLAADPDDGTGGGTDGDGVPAREGPTERPADAPPAHAVAPDPSAPRR